MRLSRCCLVPAGIALASALEIPFYTAGRAATALPFLVAVSYLAWKYGVAAFNRVVDPALTRRQRLRISPSIDFGLTRLEDDLLIVYICW